MDTPRPYVTAALLCEKVLREKDETLTLMRIIDRLQYYVEGLPEGVKPIVAIQGLVAIKSGPVTGEHKISIVAERPSGSRKEGFVFNVNLLGKDQGQNLILDMRLGIDEDGLYWFDVVFDDKEVLTRIPLIVTPLLQGQMQEQATEKKK